MFAIAASAASQTALHAKTLPPPKPRAPKSKPPPKQNKNNATTSKRQQQQPKKPSSPPLRHPKTGQLIPPILKRSDTSITYHTCRSDYDENNEEEPLECSSCRSSSSVLLSFAGGDDENDVENVTSSIRSTDSLISPNDGTGITTSVSSSIRRVDSNGNSFRVSFSKVEIREFVIQLGSAPYANGPPICLSNEPCRWIGHRGSQQKNTTGDSDGENTQNGVDDHVIVMDLLKFDKMRESDRRSGSGGLRLRPIERSQMLLALGYSMDEIAQAIIKTDHARRELMQSFQNKRWDSFNALTEKAVRKFKKFLLFDQQSVAASPSSPPSSKVVLSLSSSESSPLPKSSSMPSLASTAAK